MTWDGGGDGRSWEDPYNWDPNTVPDNNVSNTFAVTIDSGSGEIEVVWEYEHTIDRLDCYGDVVLRGPLWEWTQLALVDATIEANGEVDVWDGNLVNAGLVIIGDHELHIRQNMHNTGQVKIGTGSLGVGGILDNDANAVITGLGVIFGGQALVNNGRIFTTGGDLALATGQGTFLNSGIIGNAALTSLNVVGFPDPTNDANNQGTIEVNAGGGVAFDCNLVNVADANINLLGGTLAAKTITQSAGATFEGFGGITGDVVIEPGGIIQITGPTNIVGDVTIPAGATLEISDGQTLITGHTVCDGTIHLIGGTVVFQGGCDCTDCNIINEAGIDRNHFDLNADGIEDFKDFAYFAETWLWQASWY